MVRRCLETKLPTLRVTTQARNQPYDDGGGSFFSNCGPFSYPSVPCITVCAVEQHCCKGDERFQWEMPFLSVFSLSIKLLWLLLQMHTPHCAQTAEDINTISIAYDSQMCQPDRVKIWLIAMVTITHNGDFGESLWNHHRCVPSLTSHDLPSHKIMIPNTATRANYVNIHVKYDRRAKLLWSLLCFWQIAGNYRMQNYILRHDYLECWVRQDNPFPSIPCSA